MQQKKKKRRVGRVALLTLAVVLVGGVSAFLIYTSGWARTTVPVSELPLEGVTLIEEDAYILLLPDEAHEVGYLFWPGGLVDEAAYLTYLAAIAAVGYPCAVLKVPFHLSIFESYQSDQAMSSHPEVEVWAVGGHSLGGVMAASAVKDDPGKIGGLVLLASYANTDLSAFSIPVLSITASNDGVLAWDKWAEAKASLPASTRYVEIEGGNHGGFGTYGPQKGDGEATITQAAQRAETVAFTLELLDEVRAAA